MVSESAAGAECEDVARVAVVGDLHGSWDDWDVEYFDRSDYELLLFVGDLGGGTLRGGLQVARSIARLSKPALVMPGNNDAVHMAQLAAEFVHQKGLIKLLDIGQRRRSRALAEALGEVEVCGYSLHSLRVGGVDFEIIAGRPHSLGGPSLSFAPHMERSFGVRSIDESAARLIELVDSARGERLIFLSHNGPEGLGDQPPDIWGCDFKSGGGDWGDPDLAHAVEHARAKGKTPLAVVAGHMHLRVKGGGERPWRVERNGSLFLNAARVPRIRSGSDGPVRHHVRLELRRSGLRVQEVFVPGG